MAWRLGIWGKSGTAFPKNQGSLLKDASKSLINPRMQTNPFINQKDSTKKILGTSHGRVWTSIGRVLKIATLEGSEVLGNQKKNPPRFGSCVVWLCVFLACWEQIFVEENKIMATSKHFRYHPNRGILKPIFQLYGYGLCKGKPKIPKIAGKSQDSYILKGEPLWWFNVWMPTKTCWWFQPIWKILVKMGIFPK